MIIDYLANVFPESTRTSSEDLLLTYLRNIDSSTGSSFRGYMLSNLQQFSLKQGNRDFKGAKRVALPAPDNRALAVPLGAALARRESVRQYSSDKMTIEELSNWLAAAVGDHATAKQGVRRRHYPSGGGLYPVDIYLQALRITGLERGLYHYDPVLHELHVLDSSADTDPKSYFVDPLVMSGKTDASTWDHAAGALVLTAYMNNSYVKYGDRAWKLMLLEAGHLAQNRPQTPAALSRIAICPMGGMSLLALSKYMKLDGNAELPVYPFSFGPVDPV